MNTPGKKTRLGNLDRDSFVRVTPEGPLFVILHHFKDHTLLAEAEHRDIFRVHLIRNRAEVVHVSHLDLPEFAGSYLSSVDM